MGFRRSTEERLKMIPAGDEDLRLMMIYAEGNIDMEDHEILEQVFRLDLHLLKSFP